MQKANAHLWYVSAYSALRCNSISASDYSNFFFFFFFLVVSCFLGFDERLFGQSMPGNWTKKPVSPASPKKDEDKRLSSVRSSTSLNDVAAMERVKEVTKQEKQKDKKTFF
jgi:hypothetical protein